MTTYEQQDDRPIDEAIRNDAAEQADARRWLIELERRTEELRRSGKLAELMANDLIFPPAEASEE